MRTLDAEPGSFMWAHGASPSESGDRARARLRVDSAQLLMTTGTWPCRRVFRFRSGEVRIALERPAGFLPGLTGRIK